jgi:hypothetical protein
MYFLSRLWPRTTPQLHVGSLYKHVRVGTQYSSLKIDFVQPRLSVSPLKKK